MSKPYKLLLFTVIIFSLAIAIIVYRYERLLSKEEKEPGQGLGSVLGGQPTSKQYTVTQIIDLIKNSKEYIGDSITIFDNGDITSSNDKFQGTLQAVINSKDNIEIVRGSAKNNKLPLQYNAYVLAATYYRRQYPAEFENK